jgi:membrane-bound lytic murein transglycosylase F
MEENQSSDDVQNVEPKVKRKFKFHVIWLIYGLIGLILFVATFWYLDPTSFLERKIIPKKTAWQVIQKHKKLVAVTNSSKSGYFIYKGRPIGFQYEMLLAFCKTYHLDLEIIIEDNIYKSIQILNKNKAHILAFDFTKVDERKNMIWYSFPYKTTRQVLVQRKKNKKFVFADSLENLLGQNIIVQKGTIFKKSLQSIAAIKGLTLQITEDSINTMENMLSMVANGEIDFTVCDQHIAKVGSNRYHNLDISYVLSDQQDVCWAVGVGQDSLLYFLNKWMKEYVDSRSFLAIEKKYYRNTGISYSQENNIVSLHEGQISQYDEFFKKEAIKLGWDWRLLASLIYEESHFNANAENWSGAVGLMQLMPNTAKRFGANNPRDAVQNLKAGVKYLIYLDKILAQNVSNKDERIYFVLAAYNVGPAQVIDAINLAKKYHKKSNIWAAQVDSFLIYKSLPKFYNDEVVKSGYCHGQTAVNFVEQIFDRYQHYKNLIPY